MRRLLNVISTAFLIASVFQNFAVAQSEGPAIATAIVEVDPKGCRTNVAINGVVGQSFRLPNSDQLALEKISIWIKPASTQKTSYELTLLHGEGPLGNHMETSAVLNVGDLESGEQAGWRDFSFSGATLKSGQPYTFMLVSRNAIGGAFAQCQDRYVGGILHRPGYKPDVYSDVAFRIFGVSSATENNNALTLPPPPEPGAPARPLLPRIAKMVEDGQLTQRKIVMPLGDSITDMPAGINQQDWAGPAWGGYRREMSNDVTFSTLFQFTGSYGVYEYGPNSSVSPWSPTMPWDQRSHCGWSGATLKGWGMSGSSITENFWKCRAIAPKLDFVLLHGGSNDLRKDDEDAATQANSAVQSTLQLIEGILLNTDFSTKILVAKLIPMTGWVAGYNENVIAYNKKLEKEILFRQNYANTANTAWYWQPRVQIIDMYTAFGDKPQDLLLDGLHPNKKGNEVMAHQWLTALQENY